MIARTPMPVLLLLVVVSCGLLTGCASSSSKVRLYEGWAVGSVADGYGAIVHTADGETWVRQGSAATIPNATLVDVRAVDASHVWAVGAAAGCREESRRCTHECVRHEL